MKNDVYKETEIGEIPEGWKPTTLGDYIQITKKPKGFKLSENIAFIPMEVIPSSGVTKTNYLEIKASEMKSGVYCESGDILLSKITPSFENGKQGIAPESGCPIFSSTEIYPIKAINGLDTEYLFFFFLIPKIRTEIASKMEGSTGRQRVPKQVLDSQPILVPPLPEQRAIVHVLRTVQRDKEATDKVIASMKELKKSMMKHLFTYGSVPFGLAGRVKLKQTEIGDMPEEWEIVRIGDIVQTYSGGTPNRAHEEYYGGTIGWAKSGELADGYVFSTEEFITETGLKNSSAKYVDNGTLLVAMYGATAGKVGLAKAKFTINQAICAIVPTDQFFSEFYFYYLITRRNDLLSARFGGAQPNLNQQIIKNLLVPLPSATTQKSIADALQKLEGKLQSEQVKSQALNNLFKSLLKNLISGKVRVKDLQGVPA